MHFPIDFWCTFRPIDVGVDRKGEKETKQKLASNADGPFPVTKIEKLPKAVDLERPDCTAENLSCNLIVLPKKPARKANLMP